MTMEAGSLKYDFAGIAGLVQDINLVKATLTETHDELQAYIRNLVATWEGENQAAYAVVQDQWNRNHNDLIDTLNAISLAVQNGNDTMASTEAKLAGGWAGV